MSNKEVVFLGFSLGINIVLIITSTIFMTIAKDLNRRVYIQNQTIIELRDELSKTNYICECDKNE